jgi:hypothetical protein
MGWDIPSSGQVTPFPGNPLRYQHNIFSSLHKHIQYPMNKSKQVL